MVFYFNYWSLLLFHCSRSQHLWEIDSGITWHYSAISGVTSNQSEVLCCSPRFEKWKQVPEMLLYLTSITSRIIIIMKSREGSVELAATLIFHA